MLVAAGASKALTRKRTKAETLPAQARRRLPVGRVLMRPTRRITTVKKALLRTNYGLAEFTPAEADIIGDYAARIVWAFDSASAAQVEEGTIWYRYAQGFAQQIADDTSISLEAAAGVIAVTSNNVKWATQVQWTAPLIRDLLAGIPHREARGPFFFHGKERAARVLAGDYSAISGEKIVPFWRNISGDYSLATIDRWAVRVAVGYFTQERETQGFMRGRKRLLLDAAYHLAADVLNLDVAILQAITWCVVRGTGA